MKDFIIYQHPLGDLQAVKQGVCWPAALFGIWWFFFHGMIVEGAVAAAVGGLVIWWDLNSAMPMLLWYSIAWTLLMLVYGNALRERYLERKGYEPVGKARSHNRKQAVAAFVNSKWAIFRAA